MKGKLIGFIFYLLLMCGMGFYGGYLVFEGKYNEQLEINKNLYTVIEKKDKSYAELVGKVTEYEWQLDSCYQQIGDMQDDYDVNNDGVINAQDYVAIKNYIMSREE